MARQYDTFRKRHYVGIRHDGAYEYFSASRWDCPGFGDPTVASHGRRYAAIIGQFRSKRGALFMARYGRGNPHLQHVDDAERLARDQERTDKRKSP